MQVPGQRTPGKSWPSGPVAMGNVLSQCHLLQEPVICSGSQQRSWWKTLTPGPGTPQKPCHAGTSPDMRAFSFSSPRPTNAVRSRLPVQPDCSLCAAVWSKWWGMTLMAWLLRTPAQPAPMLMRTVHVLDTPSPPPSWRTLDAFQAARAGLTPRAAVFRRKLAADLAHGDLRRGRCGLRCDLCGLVHPSKSTLLKPPCSARLWALLDSSGA